MLFDVQLSFQVLHADVVDVEVVAGGNRADAVKNIFRPQGAGSGMHHHVGVRQDVVHGCSDGVRHLLGALKCHIA